MEETAGQVLRPLQAGQLATGPGVGDGPGELRGDGHHQGDLVVAKAARLPVAQHQHPEDPAILDDGRAEEAPVALLASLVNEHVARMSGGIIQIHWLRALADQANEAAIQGQAHAPHGTGLEAIGGLEHMLALFEIGEIDGADIGTD